MKSLTFPLAALAGMLALGTFVTRDRPEPEPQALTPVEEQSQRKPLTFEDVKDQCSEFPWTKTYGGLTVANGRVLNEHLNTGAGVKPSDSQFERQRKRDEFDKERKRIFSSQFCVEGWTRWPVYDFDAQAFKLHIIKDYIGGHRRLLPTSYLVIPYDDEPVLSYPLHEEKAEWLEAQLKTAVRNIKSPKPEHRIPVRVAFRLTGKKTSDGDVGRVVDVVAWDSPLFEKLYSEAKAK